MSPLWGAVCAVLCGVAALAVPWVIRGLPEPAPEPDLPEDEPPKPTYVDLASRRVLLPLAVGASAVSAGLLGLVLGPGWPLAYAVLATPVCVALAYIDWHTRLLPTRLVLPTTALLVLLALAEWAITGEHEQVLRAGIGLLVARSLFWVLWFVHSAGMGFGDVRLSALLGLVLARSGWAELATGVYAAFLLFAVPGLLWALVRWDRSVLKRARPFGPFMVVGALVGLLVGDVLL